MPLSGRRLAPGEKPTAKRKIELSDVVGTWNLSLETEEEELNPRLIVKEDDGKYTAVFHGDDEGVFPVKDLRTKGNLLLFTVTGKMDGKDFVAKFGARIRGTKLRGETNLKIGGETVEMALSGRLAQDSDADRSRGAE